MLRVGRALGRSSALTIGLVVFAGAPATRPSAQTPPDVAALLDDYAAGRFDAAVRVALGGDYEVAIPPLRKALQRDAPSWAAREGPAEERRRRQIAATFVLDIAHGAYVEAQRSVGAAPGQSLHTVLPKIAPLDPNPGWDVVQPVLEWACGWLRSTPAGTPMDRDWFIASVQVLRDFWDRSVATWPVPGSVKEYGMSRGHLADAIARYPEEPWFRAVVAERLAGVEEILGKESWESAIRAELGAPGGRGRFGIQGFRLDEEVADLLKMRELLAPLEPAPSVRAEVHVHLGCLAIICGDYTRARIYLSDIDSWTTDPCTRYLGHLLLGYADDAEDRPAAAENDYRAAVAILPDAPSGLTALAGLLDVQGQRPEAVALARRVFAAPGVALDPIVEFSWKGTGCTRWPETIGRLHAAILAR